MRRAFTLIELLIVVAIIAILAAIAVPNFLEAQTRSKVARTKADMRTATTALETYTADHNAVPNCHSWGVPIAVDPGAQYRILERLSTPIAYLTNSVIKDPFKLRSRLSAATAQAMRTAVPQPADDAVGKLNSYIYQSWNSDQRYTNPPDSYSRANLPQKPTAWVLHSAGPSGMYYNLGGVLQSDGESALPYTLDLIYDPTNGTISRGSIWRNGGMADSSPAYKAGLGLLLAIRTQK